MVDLNYPIYIFVSNLQQFHSCFISISLPYWISKPVTAIFIGHAFFKDVAAEFEKEIQSVEETLGDLKNLKITVESSADENGQFIYRTTVLLLETMQKAYRAELARKKRITK